MLWCIWGIPSNCVISFSAARNNKLDLWGLALIPSMADENTKKKNPRLGQNNFVFFGWSLIFINLKKLMPSFIFYVPLPSVKDIKEKKEWNNFRFYYFSFGSTFTIIIFIRVEIHDHDRCSTGKIKFMLIITSGSSDKWMNAFSSVNWQRLISRLFKLLSNCQNVFIYKVVK